MERIKKRKLIPVLICQTPKTVILLDKRFPEDEKQRRIARYLDKKGNLKIDTVKDHNVYGTK